MTRLNTQFSVKGISLLNSMMALSSLRGQIKFININCPTQFSLNSVCAIKSTDIAGNAVSPTKQARGDSGKEPKLHQWQNGEKTLGETRLRWGFSSLLARRTRSVFQLQQSQIVRAQLVPVVFSWWLSRWLGPHWGSVSRARLCVLVSGDVQGCRGRL